MAAALILPQLHLPGLLLLHLQMPEVEMLVLLDLPLMAQAPPLLLQQVLLHLLLAAVILRLQLTLPVLVQV